MKATLVFGLSILSLTGCAAAPETIQAAPVIGRPFIADDCTVMATKRQNYAAQLEIAKAQQENRRGGQVVAGLVLGVAGAVIASEATGADQEVNIANFRGAIMAIDEEAAFKQCSDPAFGKPEPKKPPMQAGSRA